MVADISSLRVLTVVWWLLWAIALWIQRRRGGSDGPLFLTLLAMLAVIHGIPATVFSLSGIAEYVVEFDAIVRGMWIAVLSALGVTLGSSLARSRPNMILRSEHGHDKRESKEAPYLRRVLVVGSACFLSFLFTPVGNLPTVRTLVAAGFVLVPVGLGMLWRRSRRVGDRSAAVWAMLGTGMLPIMTTVMLGFLGYGIGYAVLAASLGLRIRRWSLPMVVGCAAGIAVGLSLFVSYMGSRDRIRGAESLGDRIEALGAMVEIVEPFSVNRIDHVSQVASRLDHLTFLGLADRGFESGRVEAGRGQTFKDALLSLVPRALWPDKPNVAGSGNIVADYTGLKFAEGTSVGATLPFEVFVNFREGGVVLIFLVVGWLISRADSRLVALADHGDVGRAVTTAFVGGSVILATAWSLVEMFMSLLLAFCVSRALEWWSRRA